MDKKDYFIDIFAEDAISVIRSLTQSEYNLIKDLFDSTDGGEIVECNPMYCVYSWNKTISPTYNENEYDYVSLRHYNHVSTQTVESTMSHPGQIRFFKTKEEADTFIATLKYKKLLVETDSITYYR